MAEDTVLIADRAGYDGEIAGGIAPICCTVDGVAARREELAVLTREVRYTAGGWLAAECGVAAVAIVGV